MMRKPLLLAITVFATVVVSNIFAAEKIGAITASDTFHLAGARIPASAARSIPLTNGDEIKTTSATAVIMLANGSRIAIDKNSTLRTQHLGEETLLCLEEGALRFNVAQGARAEVHALARKITLQSGSEGTVSINTPDEAQTEEWILAANVEQGAPAEVGDDDATCPCDSMPAASSNSAIVVVTAIAAGAAGAGIGYVLGGDDAAATSPSTP